MTLRDQRILLAILGVVCLVFFVTGLFTGCTGPNTGSPVAWRTIEPRQAQP